MMFHKVFMFLAFFVPSQASAYNFGFVRGPDWMDPYLAALLALTAVSFIVTLILKPRGIPINLMYKHFNEFSTNGRIIYAIFGFSFVALMCLVFLGMALQRSTEAGL